jgi:signal transduction histidine kinase
MEPCDPNLPAREVYDLLLPQATSLGISLELSLSSEVAPIPMDRNAMMQCLHNLAVNALDACTRTDDFFPESPHVVIRTNCRPEEPGVEYEVEDNGRGMDGDTRNRLFQGFFTTKGKKGTGVGLMISHKTVANHQGRITCESEPGNGTRFRIFIPAFSATPHSLPLSGGTP